MKVDDKVKKNLFVSHISSLIPTCDLLRFVSGIYRSKISFNFNRSNDFTELSQTMTHENIISYFLQNSILCTTYYCQLNNNNNNNNNKQLGNYLIEK